MPRAAASAYDLCDRPDQNMLHRLGKNNYTACARLFETHARGICIDEHVNANSMREWLRPQQPFIHAVRHPLGMCVSAYIYHKQGAEPWLLKPLQDFGGVSLMQHYKTVDPTEGVRFECRRMVTELVESAILYNRTQPPSTAPPPVRPRGQFSPQWTHPLRARCGGRYTPAAERAKYTLRGV